jgi:ribosomal protein S20
LLYDKITKNSEVIMKTAKEEVKALLDKLPDDCTIEDIQYHLYVIEKVQRGIKRAKKEGTITHEEAKKRLSKWTSK